MLALVLLVCAASSGALGVRAYDVIRPSGKLTITPNVVNLDSNETFYTVSCQLDAVRDGLDSRSLYIEMGGKRIKSEIFNASTVVAVEQVDGTTQQRMCGIRKYFCFHNGSGLDVARVTVGFEPAAIDAESVKCVSEDLRELRCEIRLGRTCDLETRYELSMSYRFGRSLCRIGLVGDMLMYDSADDNQRCLYRNGVELVKFDLEVNNGIGSRVMHFVLNNYDIVRPDEVRLLRVVAVTSRKVDIRWVESVSLDHLSRDFQYQFQLITEKGNSLSVLEDVPKMIYQYKFENLLPYTKYTLKVRLRIVPKSPRVFEEQYWSRWSSVTFRTLASKPDRAPKTVPGAFSFKDRKGIQATIDVYWQPIPEHLHSGPGFTYNVSAVSDTGQWFYPTKHSTNSPVATFTNMTINHYRISVSCYNDEGSSEEHNELQVFPTELNQQPKIRRVLNKGLFEVSWYPHTQSKHLTNYTVMYCNFTSSGVCQDSIRFAVLPPETTQFRTSSSSALNFAVSANFKTHSTALTWQECIVSPTDVGRGLPRFEVVNLKERSFDVVLQNNCMERSAYELLRVQVVQNRKDVVFEAAFEPGKDRLAVRGLKPGTAYSVQVVAYGELGTVRETRDVVTRARNGDVLLSVMFYLSLGIFVVSMVFVTATRTIQKVLSIKVEIPRQLTTEKALLNEIKPHHQTEDSKQDNMSLLMKNRANEVT